jgi:uncharacterized protein YaaN involved in tellurite resistance
MMQLESEDKLEVISKSALADELKIEDEIQVAATEEDIALASQADEVVKAILSIDAKDLVKQQKQSASVTNLGRDVQVEMAKQSQMLSQPMTILVHEAEDGGKVATSLLSLQEQVNIINPNRVDFTMSTIRRLLAKLPGVGTALSRWFAKYQAVSAVISDIVKSLKDGKSQLERDNTTLQDDQRRMRELTFKLEEYIKLGQLLDQKLAAAIESQVASNDDRMKFLQEEVLFPLRQRVTDLQQQLAVNQQGILATEVIIRNNHELVKGVDRALNVTITALNTAATLQVALVRQGKVLTGVQAVTETTNELLVETSETLKNQGVEIQKQASQAQLDVEMLKTAFNNVEQALNDISSFRREALPEMAKSIVAMDDLTKKMSDSIETMQSGNEVSKEINDDLGLLVIDDK